LLELVSIFHVFLTDTSSLIATTEAKPSPWPEATSNNFQQGQTSPLPQMTSLTSAAATSSMSEPASIISTMSEIRLASSAAAVAVLANLVPNTGEFSQQNTFRASIEFYSSPLNFLRISLI